MPGGLGRGGAGRGGGVLWLLGGRPGAGAAAAAAAAAATLLRVGACSTANGSLSHGPWNTY